MPNEEAVYHVPYFGVSYCGIGTNRASIDPKVSPYVAGITECERGTPLDLLGQGVYWGLLDRAPDAIVVDEGALVSAAIRDVLDLGENARR